VTTAPPADHTADTPKVARQAQREWEDSTRALADRLMATAQELSLQGRTEDALARADEAVCEVVSIPPGYEIRSAYLEYLANLIDEVEEIEALALRPELELRKDEEVVILPPLDLYVDDDAEAEIAPIDEGPLPDSDYPLVMNPTVEKFLAAMSADGEYHHRIEAGLARAGTFLPMIREQFSGAGLPLDLAYLPLIESAFSVRAYSRARALGMWQFIASTGRYYGLDIGSLVDERRDPELSTAAAAAYLTDLYEEFGDWHLALAAYNSGAGNVRRAVRRSGSRDFWTLRRYLPRETRNYVPAYIASVIVAKRPEAHGFEPPRGEPWAFETVDVPDALDLEFLASGAGIPVDDLRTLNPAIRRDLTPARRTTVLRVPPGTTGAVNRLLAETPRSEWAPRMLHTVRSGDSLYAIARRYGSTVSAIRQANGLRGSLIRPGQSLVVPRFGSGASPPATAVQRTASGGTYTVRKNDTLWDIARAFSVSLDSLCDANGLSRRDVIRPGQTLRIPGRSTSSSPPSRSVTAPASAGTHTVARGDTLYDIANLYGVSVNELKRANGLAGSRIYPGKVLQIPAPTREPASAPARSASDGTTYRVRAGDTLYDIARRFGVSVAALRDANGLRTSRIYPGDVLQIPTSNAKS
jgi:membrane-bound lytic murein transglycosylase D